MIKYSLYYSDEGGAGYFNFYRASEVDDQNKELVQIAARWEAICDLLDGNDPSDFMLSFPEVMHVADLVAATQPIAPVDGQQSSIVNGDCKPRP